MLGVIHRGELGQGPEQLRFFFKLADGRHPHGRNTLRSHDKQIATFRNGTFLETTSHSILGLVDIYNLLPPGTIETDDVHIFQAKLQSIMKVQSATNGEWETMFSARLPLHSHPLRRLLNGVSSRCAIPENYEMGEFANDGMVGLDLATIDKPPAWW